jgi:hypothetical protein
MCRRNSGEDPTAYSLSCRWHRCDEEFDTCEDARVHEHNEHVVSQKIKRKVCRIGDCKATFLTLFRLIRHVEAHGLRRYVCDTCTDKFSRAEQLRSHLSTVHGVNLHKEEYSCEEEKQDLERRVSPRLNRGKYNKPIRGMKKPKKKATRQPPPPRQQEGPEFDDMWDRILAGDSENLILLTNY